MRYRPRMKELGDMRDKASPVQCKGERGGVGCGVREERDLTSQKEPQDEEEEGRGEVIKPKL